MTARVQDFPKVKSSAVSSTTITPGSAVTVGNLCVLGLYYSDDLTTAKIHDATNGDGKDSLGNTWTMLGPVDLSVDGDFGYLAYSVITVGGTPTITFVASAGTHTFWIHGREYSPTNAWSLDQVVTTAHNAGSGSLTAGSQTPSTAAGVAVVAWALTVGEAGLVYGSGWATSPLNSADGVYLWTDQIYSTTTALAPTASLSNTPEWGGILAVFKDATAGGGGTVVSRAVTSSSVSRVGSRAGEF